MVRMGRAPASSPPATARLVLRGEIDLAQVGAVEARLRAVEAERPDVLVLELSQVRFMDVSGLRLLLRAHERLRAAGGRLVVLAASPRVRRLLSVTGMADRLDLVEAWPAG
jgi:anti-sigma B factor antagonist